MNGWVSLLMLRVFVSVWIWEFDLSNLLVISNGRVRVRTRRVVGGGDKEGI